MKQFTISKSFANQSEIFESQVIRTRNIAEPRTFVTKWEKELNDKASRKKAFSRERDSKRGENFVNTQYEDICDYAQLIGLDDDDFYMTYNEDDKNMLIKMWKMSMNRYTKDENQKDIVDLTF